MNTVPRVMIVEDHPAVCAGLRLLLEQSGIQVCCEAHGIAQALEPLRSAPADLVMVDLALGDGDGLDLLRLLSKQSPGLPLLVYSMYEDASHVTQAFRAGALGYVTKREAADVLAHAIRECIAGRSFMSPRAAQGVPESGHGQAYPEPLSHRELAVYDLLGDAYSVQEIADKLELSRRTVETYFGRIQVKLRLPGMRELRRHAVAHRSADRR